VFERGHTYPNRVRTGRGLSQLIRIAEQDEVASGWGDGNGVRQRDLPSLINKESVERFNHAFASEQPRGPGDDVDARYSAGSLHRTGRSSKVDFRLPASVGLVVDTLVDQDWSSLHPSLTTDLTQ
jgi:hypothetical protein